VARRLHASSPRASRPLVTVNAGAIAEGLFESELFGHVKGAFTDARTDRVGSFELADGGTLFLDEIGTMPSAHQAKLLRVLQTGEFQRVGSSGPRPSTFGCSRPRTWTSPRRSGRADSGRTFSSG
jgi:transcriptional regulator with GAF, ATPase, and Fis domain